MRNDPEHGGFVHTSEAARTYVIWAGSVCVIFAELSVVDADAMIHVADESFFPP